MAEPDVVIIGTGPTGAMAAAAMAGRGLDVLVLDAGLRAPGGWIARAAGNTLYRHMAWAEYASDRIDGGSPPNVDWYSSLSLGGLSNYWTAAVPRFAPEDFTEGERLDVRYRWPVGYDELVPHYEAAERHLVVTAGGPIHGVPSNVRRYDRRLPKKWQAIAERAARAGHGIGALPMAKGRPWMVARRGTEFNSYRCVIEPLLAGGELRLLAGAHAVGLTWSGQAGRVEAVQYVDRATGDRRAVRCRAVVVAAGPIDSTVLLMRSRSADFPTGLGNAHDLLGRYLHDHPREWWIARLARPLRVLTHPVYIARTPHGQSPPLYATSLTLGLYGYRQRLLSLAGGSATTFGVQVFGTMIPTPDLSLTLPTLRDDDPFDARPRITLAYDGPAVANITAARQRLREVLADGGVEVTVPGPFHELRPGSSVHYGGSVRMHDDPTFGVLDRWNRIHDVPNVAVVDASCFTTGAEKNPTLTAMALASRAADRLAHDLESGAL